MAQAPSLLRGPPSHGGLFVPVGRDHPQPGCGGQNRQVVGGTDGRCARRSSPKS
jgi:hypothetical protein